MTTTAKRRLTKLEATTGAAPDRPAYVWGMDLEELERKLAELPPGSYKSYLGFRGPDEWDNEEA